MHFPHHHHHNDEGYDLSKRLLYSFLTGPPLQILAPLLICFPYCSLKPQDLSVIALHHLEHWKEVP